MPFQFTGVRVECHDGAGVKVVAGPRISIPVGTGITGAPIHEIEFGVIAAGRPDGAAAMLPRFTAPGFIAGLTGLWDDVKAPLLVAGFCVESGHIAANSVFTARGTENDFVFYDKGCNGEGIV